MRGRHAQNGGRGLPTPIDQTENWARRIRAAIDADIQATLRLRRTMAFALCLYRDGFCAIFDKEPRQRNEKYSFSKAFNHRAKTT